ncbi:hypothetical protein TNCV_4298441 [Trichonephila clavipes]|nr:hypothetical protein TNCV_4298441 [Trichonephila clavipes]
MNASERHNKEVQFIPEKAEKGTIVHTSRSEQDQATRMPDEEVINNGKARKGEERVQRNPCYWRSCHKTGNGDRSRNFKPLSMMTPEVASPSFNYHTIWRTNLMCITPLLGGSLLAARLEPVTLQPHAHDH